MAKTRKVLGIFSLAFILGCSLYITAAADRDDDQEQHRNRERKGQKNGPLSSVENEAYLQQCSACHFAYQPGLLPRGSWSKIMDSLPGHFGEELSIDTASLQTIRTYLNANAAEQSSSKQAKKILRSLKGDIPLRITDIPYIREEHNDLNESVFQRQSIGSRSNCIACHTTADKGNYDDDMVKVPE